MKFLIEPFTYTINEYKNNRDLSKKVEGSIAKSKVNRLVYFNALLFLIYASLYLATLFYMIVGIVIHPLGFIPITTTLITVIIARLLQVKVYPKMKKNYLKNILEV